MATYKKQLKDADGNNIYPVQGSGTIVSDNIDTSTLPGANGTANYSGNRAGTSWGDVSGASYTATEAGLYALTLHAGVFTAMTSAILRMRLRIGSSYYYETDLPVVTNYAGNKSACLDVSAVRWLESNTTIALQTALENDSSHSVGASLYVTRIY